MKVLLVNGSPHKEGCTSAALEFVAESLRNNGVEADMFWVGNKPIIGCIDCQFCAGKGVCVYNDVVNEFLGKVKDYDGFVFGTPVHWAAASGAITSFMDRVFYAALMGGENPFVMKPAAAVVAARRSGTTATWDQLNKYFGLVQMPIISSRYWNNVHGVRNPEHVAQDEEGVQVMRVLGNNMAYYLKCQEAAQKAGIEIPEQEPFILTNFIR